LQLNEANKYQTNNKQITNKQTTKTHQQTIATGVPLSEHNVLSQSAFGNRRGQTRLANKGGVRHGYCKATRAEQ
jgi:hypothetical protein